MRVYYENGQDLKLLFVLAWCMLQSMSATDRFYCNHLLVTFISFFHVISIWYYNYLFLALFSFEICLSSFLFLIFSIHLPTISSHNCLLITKETTFIFHKDFISVLISIFTPRIYSCFLPADETTKLGVELVNMSTANHAIYAQQLTTAYEIILKL